MSFQKVNFILGKTKVKDLDTGKVYIVKYIYINCSECSECGIHQEIEIELEGINNKDLKLLKFEFISFEVTGIELGQDKKISQKEIKSYESNKYRIENWQVLDE